MTSLGAELASARRDASRSLRAVAEAASISAAYLQKLEGDRVRSPSPTILRSLAEELGLDYARLMSLAGYVPADVRQPEGALAARLAEAGLTEVEERAVSAFVDHLLNQRR